MFKGFSTVKYPVYTVITPQTGKQYDTRALNVAELNKLKNSLSTPTSITRIITETIWSVLDGLPNDIKTYDEFINNTTIPDRNALLYGVHHSTFGEDREFRLTCPCENTQLVKLKMSEMLQINFYPGCKSVMDSYRLSKSRKEADFDEEIESRLSKIAKPPEGMPDDIAKDNYPEYFEELEKIEEERKEKRLKQKEELETEEVVLNNDGEVVIKQVEKNTEDDSIKEISEEEVENETEQKKKKKKPGRPPKKDNKKEEKEEVQENSSDQEYKSIVEERIIEPLPESGVYVYIKQPTLKDEFDFLEDLIINEETVSLIYDCMLIEKFEEYDPKTGELVQTVDDRTDIFEAYQTLLPRDRVRILELYTSNFGDYGIDLSTLWKCKSCGRENTVRLDLFDEFFRMVNRY